MRSAAEFRMVREALGLTVRWLADALDVTERTVHRWEAGSVPIPEGVVRSLGEYQDQFRRHVEQTSGTVLRVPRTDAEARDGFPASWWRAVAYRSAEASTGLRVEYI